MFSHLHDVAIRAASRPFAFGHAFWQGQVVSMEKQTPLVDQNNSHHQSFLHKVFARLSWPHQLSRDVAQVIHIWSPIMNVYLDALNMWTRLMLLLTLATL